MWLRKKADKSLVPKGLADACELDEYDGDGEPWCGDGYYGDPWHHATECDIY